MPGPYFRKSPQGSIAKLLHSFRKDCGLSQLDAAKVLRIAPLTYVRYEKGEITPRATKAIWIGAAMAGYLKTPVARPPAQPKRQTITVYLKTDLIKAIGKNPSQKLRAWIESEAPWKGK